jgi:hypothetical protein
VLTPLHVIVGVFHAKQAHPWVVPLGTSHLIFLDPLNFEKSLKKPFNKNINKLFLMSTFIKFHRF